MNIKWKQVIGYEGTHEVSNNGLVRGLVSRWGARDTPLNLCIRHNRYGYPEVRLTADGKTKRKNVHRLVAEAFIPNPDSKPIVNHRDGNKRNNSINNLEWVTHKENHSHAVRMGLTGCVGETNSNAKLTEKDVREIRCLYAETDLEQNDLSDMYNVTQSHISSICLGKLWDNIPLYNYSNNYSIT